jgi:ribonuclease G
LSLEIIINSSDEEDRVAVLSDGVFVEYLIERKDEPSRVGNIYKGVVKKVVGGMEAAFIDIGLGRNAFLYLSKAPFDEEMYKDLVNSSLIEEFDVEKMDLGDVIQAGQEILVQVTKEPTPTKGAKVTSQITLPGYYLVLVPTARHIWISRRITSEDERARLINIMKEIVPPGMGAIARTNAQGKDAGLFRDEIERLLERWKRIKRVVRGRSRKGPVYEEVSLPKRILRDFVTNEIKKVVIDSPSQYEEIIEFLSDYGLHTLSSNVSLYTGVTPIFDAFGIEEEIKTLLNRKVWLKSGGYIIIDEVEALVTIDVNTGRYTGGRNLEETIFHVNLEAAKEVAKQLRLRNLGGIIVVDFIDMKDESHRREVIATLERELAHDRIKCNLFEITKLGLVEITRRRIYSSMDELLREDCPLCRGEGRLLSRRSLEVEIIRRMKGMERGFSKKAFMVRLNPQAYDVLIGSEAIEKVAKELGMEVRFSKEDSFRWEDVEVVFV